MSTGKHAVRGRGFRGRGVALLGVWAGALPLIHTHSFLALGLASLGAMVYDLIHGDPNAMIERRPRKMILLPYLIYGGIAAALAAPQLFGFTFLIHLPAVIDNNRGAGVLGGAAIQRIDNV